MNLILSIAVIVVASGLLYFWLKRGEANTTYNEQTLFEIPKMILYIREAMINLVSDEDDFIASEEEVAKRKERKNTLRKALRVCMQGDLKMKKYVKTWINTLLLEYGLNEKTIEYVIPFNKTEQLSVQDMFEILLFHFFKKHRYNALDYMIRHYQLNKLRKLPDGTDGYIIYPEDIKRIYQKERPKLAFKDKLSVVVQRVYQIYKGLGVMDEIRDMNIDGASGGVSGLSSAMADKLNVVDFIKTMNVPIPNCYDSAWIMHKGVTIYLAFLSFGSEKELKRVCQNIYTNGYPGPLPETVGYKINEMADGSRVVVIRPNLGENWAFFVRKFDDSIVAIDQLIKGKNADYVVQLIDYFVKGHRSIAVTGPQGVGKTTLLKVICGFIKPELNIRVLELAFELFLKKYYLFRNIFTLRETLTVSAQEALDMSKKTDGGVIVLGEVASHPVAKIAIQISQSASAQVLLSNHANTAKDLVEWFSDGLDVQDPEVKAAHALNIDIHLTLDEQYGRHIERITEIVPIIQRDDYPQDYRDAKSLKEAIVSFMDTQTEYFRRSTDKKTFTYHNIIEFREGEFIPVQRPSQRMVKDMLRKLGTEKGNDFLQLLDEIKWEQEAEGAA